jgi:hypothetical protein
MIASAVLSVEAEAPVAKTTKKYLTCWLALLILHPGLAQADEWIYTVVDGDNLWNFSEKHLDSVWRFEDLQRLNNIEEPRKMPPGTLIRVPMEWIPAGTPAPAVIESMAGEATVYRALGGSQTLGVNDELRLGDRVRTAVGASLIIRLADESRLTLREDSELRMDTLSVLGETGMVDSRVNLLSGRADSSVTKAVGPGSRYEIETPSAISAVRGTEFRSRVSDGGVAAFEVLEGEVEVAAQGQSESVPAGYGTVVAKGAAPLSPVALLAAPARAGYAPQDPDNGTTLNWLRVTGAAGYRVEVATDAAFLHVVDRQNASQSNIELARLDEGDYHARVRGVDSNGLEGRATAVAFSVPADPPPVMVDATVLNNGENVLVAWNPGSATRFEVQVAGDRAFTELLVARTQTEPQLTLAAEASADRYVRVRELSAEGEAGPWGDIKVIESTTSSSEHWPFLQGLGVAALALLLLL